jgi:lipoprotein-releasing system ATP-binding protein
MNHQGNLDTASRKFASALSNGDELGQTFVIVTHNEETSQYAFDRKLVMVDGLISN